MSQSPLGVCTLCGKAHSIYTDCQTENNLPPKDTRVFATGATRDADDSKLDYEGFLAPSVLHRFAQYMHAARLRNVPPGQTIRSSDNWQKGIPIDAYMKSLLRHTMEVWSIHRGVHASNDQMIEDALCAIIFNAQGYLFELLKRPKADTVATNQSR